MEPIDGLFFGLLGVYLLKREGAMGCVRPSEKRHD